MAAHRIVSASELKAKCLDILDRNRSKELERVVVTKRGVPVAVLVPPPADAGEVARLHGFFEVPLSFPPRLISRHPSPTKPLPPMRVRYTGEPERTSESSVAGQLRCDLACQR